VHHNIKICQSPAFAFILIFAYVYTLLAVLLKWRITNPVSFFLLMLRDTWLTYFWVPWKNIQSPLWKLATVTSISFAEKSIKLSIRIWVNEQELSSGWDGRLFRHNRHGPKRGGTGIHLTQCGLGQGLSPCQVASWSIQSAMQVDIK